MGEDSQKSLSEHRSFEIGCAVYSFHNPIQHRAGKHHLIAGRKNIHHQTDIAAVFRRAPVAYSWNTVAHFPSRSCSTSGVGVALAACCLQNSPPGPCPRLRLHCTCCQLGGFGISAAHRAASSARPSGQPAQQPYRRAPFLYAGTLIPSSPRRVGERGRGLCARHRFVLVRCVHAVAASPGQRGIPTMRLLIETH